MSATDKALIQFARDTLRILEEHEVWGPDTPEDIAQIALKLKLARTDRDGTFVVINKEPTT